MGVKKNRNHPSTRIAGQDSEHKFHVPVQPHPSKSQNLSFMAYS